MIHIAFALVLLTLPPITSEPFKDAFNTYLKAVNSDQPAPILAPKPESSLDFALSDKLKIQLPGFGVCSMPRRRSVVASSTPWAVSCMLMYRNATTATDEYDAIVEGFKSLLPDGYHKNIFIPLSNSLLPVTTIRSTELRRGPTEAYVDLSLTDDTLFTTLWVTINQGKAWAYPLASVQAVVTASDAATLSDGYCEADFRNGRYIVQTTKGFWLPDFPPLLRAFLLAHERAHLELDHLRLRSAPDFSEAARMQQEVDADRAALSNLAGVYGASFPAFAARLLQDAIVRFKVTTAGHPGPHARLTQMTRDIAEAIVLFASNGVADSPVDLSDVRLIRRDGGTSYQVSYRNFSSHSVKCDIEVPIVPKKLSANWIPLRRPGEATAKYEHVSLNISARSTARYQVFVPTSSQELVALPPSIVDHTGSLNCESA